MKRQRSVLNACRTAGSGVGVHGHVWGVAIVCFLPLLLVGLLFLQLRAAPGETAATITVTTTQDELNTDGDCSLREAIETVNLGSQVDGCVIAGGGDFVIDIPAGGYFITKGSNNEQANQGGDFDIMASVTLQGAGASDTRIDANLKDRIFDIDPTDSVTIAVTIADVTIQNGNPISGTNGGGVRNLDDTVTILRSIVSDNRLTGASGFIANGGGVASGVSGIFDGEAVVNLIDSVIDDNSSTFGSAGGIYNYGGLLNINRSTISNNQAEVTSGTASAGGVSNVGGTVNILNSTISGNESDGHTGGLQNFFSFGVMNVANSTVTGNRTLGSGGGIRNYGEMHLTNVTVSNNTADTDGAFGGLGGGIRNNGTLYIKGTIVYGNVDVDSPAVDNDESHDIHDTGTLVSAGFNLLGVITGTTTMTDGVNHDQVGVDPLLGSLTGSPAYYPLGAFSTALNVMSSTDCTFISGAGNTLFSDGGMMTADQAGNLRPAVVTGRCDAGAFEAQFEYIYLPLVIGGS